LKRLADAGAIHNTPRRCGAAWDSKHLAAFVSAMFGEDMQR
jgi:hypothetical protein